MKKTFRSYGVVWAICFTFFNAVVFLIPQERAGNFWLGYGFITVAFLGQFICTRIAFKAENAQKFFYRFPLLSLSFIGTLCMLGVGGLTMAIPAVPVWLGAIGCLAVLAFTAIAVVSASAAGDAVGAMDETIKVKTLFIKTLTADAHILQSKATTDDGKTIARKVYEAVRYSDPTSHTALQSIEAQITIQFKKFETAVCGNADDATTLGEQLIILIEDRNTKCRLYKGHP